MAVEESQVVASDNRPGLVVVVVTDNRPGLVEVVTDNLPDLAANPRPERADRLELFVRGGARPNGLRPVAEVAGLGRPS